MNIHQFLLSLGTASFLVFPASTVSLGNVDSPASNNSSARQMAPADTAPLTRSQALKVVPAGQNGVPGIYFPGLEAEQASTAPQTADQAPPIQAVISHSGAPPGIVFSDRDAETPRLNFRNGREQEQVMNVVVAAKSGIPTGIDISARNGDLDSDMAIEYGAPSRTINDPLDFVQNASLLLEYEIQNEDGERLGTVQDFIIDKQSGRVELVAAGSGEDLRLIPPQALEPIIEESRIVLDLEADRWEDAPTVSRDELKEVALNQEIQEIYEFYGIGYRPAIAHAREAAESRNNALAAEEDEAEETLTETAATSRGPTLRNPRFHQTNRGTARTPQQPFNDADAIEFGAADREGVSGRQADSFWATDVLGAQVESEAGTVGEVTDLIVDLHVGYLQHAIISQIDSSSVQSYAIPIHELDVTSEGSVRLLRNPASLDEAPEFDARMARLRRYEPFRYETAETPLYGAPNRPAEADEPEDNEGAREL